jgi:hypothetical protein
MTMTSFLWVLGFFLAGALNVVFSVWVTCRLPAWRQNPTAAFDFADMGGVLIVVFFFGWWISFPFMLYSFIEMNWKRRPRPLRTFLVWLWIKLQP